MGMVRKEVSEQEKNGKGGEGLGRWSGEMGKCRSLLSLSSFLPLFFYRE